MPFLMPTSVELTQIAQDLIPTLQAGRVAFDIMPTRNVDRAMVQWDQEDNYAGLQQVRGFGGEPGRVYAIGYKRWSMQPGAYGEFIRFDETELTEYRTPGTFADPIDLSELVMKAQLRLLQRRLDRIEYTIWQALQGSFVVARDNVMMHADTWQTQTYSASVSWATAATATPLLDFRKVQLLHRGHSVVFNAQAKAYMNQKTFNNLVANTNNADLYGRRVAGLATANGLKGINDILTEDDLPTIVIYDSGYLDDTNPGGSPTTFTPSSENQNNTTFNTSNGFVPFIPDNTVLVVGNRPGNVPLGEIQFTRNVQNPGFAPGPYMLVIDHLEDSGQVPRTLDVHDGFNGGPAIQFPSAIVKMSV